jgi:hypothetical protein
MKIQVETFKPVLADYGEPVMELTNNTRSSYVTYFDYLELHKKYVRARASLQKEKLKNKK